MSQVKTNSVVLGQSPTDANNFLLDTDAAGALRIRRKSDGSGGLVMSINSAGIPLDKDGLDMRPLGVGQTRQNVTGSRALATDYTNNTGRTIFVEAHGAPTGGSAGSGYLTTVTVGGNAAPGGSAVQGYSYWNVAFPVPPGATYRISVAVASTLVGWVETRT